MDDDKVLQLVLQYLGERGFAESVQTLKRVSGDAISALNLC